MKRIIKEIKYNNKKNLNLSKNIESLTKYFENNFGEVHHCLIMRDKNSGKTRGFGYVTFKNSLVVQSILAQPHIFIDGKKVECKIAVPKDHLDKSSMTKIIEMLNEGNLNNIEELKQQEKNKSLVYPNKIFVGGLPLSLSKGNFFSNF